MNQPNSRDTARNRSAEISRNNRGKTRQMIALVLALSTPLSACVAPELTPAEKLVEKFGQNFDPNDYGHFADKAYNISDSRDKDPNSSITCKGQDLPTMTEDELVYYMANCDSRQRILEFFQKKALKQSAPSEAKPKTVQERDLRSASLQAARSVEVDDINIDPQLYQIYALLGKDPELYTSFMRTIMTYRAWDLTDMDTFRHPIDTMRSGWTDCDDWTVEHYFWAHIHDYSPNLVIAVKPESTGEQTGSIKKVHAHTFATYADQATGKTVVLDNQNWRTLGPNETVEDYVRAEYPDENLTVEFNGPYISQ